MLRLGRGEVVVAAETTAAKQNRPQTRRRGRRGSLTALVFIAATALAAVANIHLAQGNALDGIRCFPNPQFDPSSPSPEYPYICTYSPDSTQLQEEEGQLQQLQERPIAISQRSSREAQQRMSYPDLLSVWRRSGMVQRRHSGDRRRGFVNVAYPRGGRLLPRLY